MTLRRTVRDDRGATAVEYGLIVALIAVVILGAVVVLGGNLGGLFTGAANAVANPAGAGGTAPEAAPEPVPEPAPLGPIAPAAGDCTAGNKSGSYNCLLATPSEIDGVAVSYAYQCQSSSDSCGNVTWNRPSLQLSGWGNPRSATVTVTWTFPGSTNFQPANGTVVLAFT